jgi:cytosine/adenosine deaminase-related metal-dependent hydrolase
MHERLGSLQRGRFRPGALLDAAANHAGIGWPDAGRLQAGALADLVAVRLDTVRTAGSSPEQVLFSATAADVDTVVTGGRLIVENGRHRLGDVGRLLTDAITPLWEENP